VLNISLIKIERGFYLCLVIFQPILKEIFIFVKKSARIYLQIKELIYINTRINNHINLLCLGM